MNAPCTLFTTVKAFAGHNRIIQRNALRNWRTLGLPGIILGNDAGAAEAAEEFGLLHIADIKKTEHGTPLLSDMFVKAQEAATTPLVCCINADILLPPTFLTALEAASLRWERFLMLGQRWDIDIDEELPAEAARPEALEALRKKRGTLHSPWGMDYFAFPRGMVQNMPPFAVGRPGWDLWLIWSVAAAGIPLLNATRGVPVLHQNHGYAHVPSGRKDTYSGPEGDVNMLLSRQDAPELHTAQAHASVYRAEWRFDGTRIMLDNSWGRLWWFIKNKMRSQGVKGLCLVLLCGVLGSERYDALRKKYLQLRKGDAAPPAKPEI